MFYSLYLTKTASFYEVQFSVTYFKKAYHNLQWSFQFFKNFWNCYTQFSQKLKISLLNLVQDNFKNTTLTQTNHQARQHQVEQNHQLEGRVAWTDRHNVSKKKGKYIIELDFDDFISCHEGNMSKLYCQVPLNNNLLLLKRKIPYK